MSTSKSEYHPNQKVQLLVGSHHQHPRWIDATVIGITTITAGFANPPAITGWQFVDKYGHMYWHSVVSAETYVRPLPMPQAEFNDRQGSLDNSRSTTLAVLSEGNTKLRADLIYYKELAEVRLEEVNDLSKGLVKLKKELEELRKDYIAVKLAHKSENERANGLIENEVKALKDLAETREKVGELRSELLKIKDAANSVCKDPRSVACNAVDAVVASVKFQRERADAQDLEITRLRKNLENQFSIEFVNSTLKEKLEQRDAEIAKLKDQVNGSDLVRELSKIQALAEHHTGISTMHAHSSVNELALQHKNRGASLDEINKMIGQVLGDSTTGFAAAIRAVDAIKNLRQRLDDAKGIVARLSSVIA